VGAAVGVGVGVGAGLQADSTRTREIAVLNLRISYRDNGFADVESVIAPSPH